MWSTLVGALLGKVAPKVADYYIQKKALEHERELEKIKGKIEWEKALTRRASESEGRDHEWELESIRNSGWKDELVLLVLTVPLVLVFVPPMQPYVTSGFESLETTPDWYRWLTTMIFAAIYGIRIWRRDVSKG